MQQPFLNTACHCELAVWLLFFETSQSCVSAMVTLSHRFKSSPAIPGKPAIPSAAGYLMNAGHFYESHVSSGDLNRPRSPEVRKPLACFLVLFARRKKNVKTSLSQEVPRFRKPRISAHKQQPRTIQLYPSAALGGILSAVSDAQKLATGNFVHVRAAFVPAAAPLDRRAAWRHGTSP